jgi:hypothetical protein
VFLQFLGVRTTLPRDVALVLVITATAGLFTLGFAPIVWFIDATTHAAGDSSITPAGLARLLLGVSLLMGLVQMTRCLASCRRDDGTYHRVAMPLVLWIALLVFIVWRMAGELGIVG